MDNIFHVSSVSGLFDELYSIYFFLVYGHCSIYYT